MAIHEGNRQMRLYDMNKVREFYRTNATMRGILHDYPSRVDFGNIEDNLLMVNVYSYAPGWRVTICEGNEVLPCEQVYTEDPYHTLTYDIACYSTYGYYSYYYATTPTTHLFKAQASTATEPVTVRVIDTFGNIYIQSISRPHNYNLNMEKQEKVLTAGDVNADGEINVADVNTVIDCMMSDSNSCPLILADCNADNEINIADINMIIHLIINSSKRLCE